MFKTVLFKSVLFQTAFLLTGTSLIPFASANIPVPPAFMMESATLSEAEMSPRHIGSYLFSGAEISVRHGATPSGSFSPQRVTLTIHLKKNCTAGLACTMEIPNPVRAELDIVRVSKGSCGETVLVASHDGRPYDGALEEIVITDYRSMICRMFVPNPTHVTYRTTYYDRVLRSEVMSESKLEGEALRN